MTKGFSLKSRMASFRHAWRGIIFLIHEQHNARLHLVATLLVLVIAIYFPLQRWEWAALLLAVGVVWVAEALNTSIEYLADVFHPQQHPLIKRAKDIAAAAVLIISLLALLTGGIIFFPYFFND